jgi:hypothetical protein
MYILIVLIISEVKASGSATLSFIFPNSGEKEFAEKIIEKREPEVKLLGVREESGELMIDLSSRESLELKVLVFYGDEVKSYSGIRINGIEKIVVPIVPSGSREKVRWVNILWENDNLFICNASEESLPDLSCVENDQFVKN